MLLLIIFVESEFFGKVEEGLLVDDRLLFLWKSWVKEKFKSSSSFDISIYFLRNDIL